MKITRFYIIKDSFFEDMDEPYLKGNKEGNRPHYYCFFRVVVVSLVYEVIIILYVRNDAEAHLWKEEQFEQGI